MLGIIRRVLGATLRRLVFAALIALAARSSAPAQEPAQEPAPKKPKLCWYCPACKYEIPCEPWQEKRLTLCPSCHKPMNIEIDHHYSRGPNLGGTELFAIVGLIAFAAAAVYRLTRTYMARRQVLREGETA